MREDSRKCFKCGATPAVDGVKLFRALKPGLRNMARCELWASYMYAGRNIHSVEFLNKIYQEHRMLCDRHFNDDDFTDSSRKRLLQTAVPCDIKKPKLKYAIIDVPVPKSGEVPLAKSTDAKTTVCCYVCKDPGHGDAVCPLRYRNAVDGIVSSSTSNDDNLYTITPSGILQINEGDQKISNVDNDDTELWDSDEIPDAKQDTKFSWEQQDNAVVPCDVLELSPPPPPSPRDPPPADRAHYVCNFCSAKITGFRYTCVQCLDVDLCGACEARQLHDTHYVLRIPPARPQAEVAARLHTIRRALLADAILTVPMDDSLADIKVEPEDSNPIDVDLADTDAEIDEDPADAEIDEDPADAEIDEDPADAEIDEDPAMDGYYSFSDDEIDEHKLAISDQIKEAAEDRRISCSDGGINEPKPPIRDVTDKNAAVDVSNECSGDGSGDHKPAPAHAAAPRDQAHTTTNKATLVPLIRPLQILKKFNPSSPFYINLTQLSHKPTQSKPTQPTRSTQAKNIPVLTVKRMTPIAKGISGKSILRLNVKPALQPSHGTSAETVQTSSLFKSLLLRPRLDETPESVRKKLKLDI